MQPGELTEWNVSAQAVETQKKVDTDYYTSWIEGILIFRSEPLDEILARVEAYYNVEIELADNVDGTFKLTGKLDLNDAIEQTMENLSLTASAKYQTNGTNVYLISK